MSKAYPSRRELRLQREREERARLRDEESQRWAEEVEQRQERGAETDSPAEDPTPQPQDAETSDANEDTDTGQGRRASVRPVDTPPEVDHVATETTESARRRRRADAEITSTGMIPLITKQRDEQKADKPRSRREMRQLEAQRAAQRRAEIARLERLQANVEEEPRQVRRATSPQAPPPPIPAAAEHPVKQDSSATADEPASAQPEPSTTEREQFDGVDLTFGQVSDESATEITDMSGLDTIEIRRAELRVETEKLTQEIMRLGQANPNVIDPVMLRRQKELADKSQELQKLETDAIAIVEETEQADTETDPHTAADAIDTVESDQTPATVDDSGQQSDPQLSPRRRARRAQSKPMITGPFTIDDEPDTGHNVPETFDAITQPARPSARDSGDPVEASTAHGLDSLDAKEVEAPERRLMMVSTIIFAIGIIALITAIILLIR